jgi:hypothetical protein
MRPIREWGRLVDRWWRFAIRPSSCRSLARGEVGDDLVFRLAIGDAPRVSRDLAVSALGSERTRTKRLPATLCAPLASVRTSPLRRGTRGPATRGTRATRATRLTTRYVWRWSETSANSFFDSSLRATYKPPPIHPHLQSLPQGASGPFRFL